MIQQIAHEKADTVGVTVPAGVALALAVAKELHSPANLPVEGLADCLPDGLPAGRTPGPATAATATVPTAAVPTGAAASTGAATSTGAAASTGAATALATATAPVPAAPAALDPTGSDSAPDPDERPVLAAHRIPEAAEVPQLMGLRTSPARPHRHKVPLRRLTAMAA
ncbi:hypothetical protein [Streptomyces sennicomposti]|uniref:hypothetical protein n=1 Tax=Streptomyces sennicomposti TaxID=2873384 RepID=UPI001CA7054C|nr:hypothetical protein [Streptomyces sennicomposti]MBY8866715.1 hypothetical protein [Streptomyces sennicomposti]